MPTYRPTNAGLQTKGTLWGGFDPTTTSVIAGVFMVTVMVTFGGISMGAMPWYVVVPFCFLLPNALLLLAVFKLVMGKPPGYVKDWAESYVLGRTTLDRSSIPEPVRPDISE